MQLSKHEKVKSMNDNLVSKILSCLPPFIHHTPILFSAKSVVFGSVIFIIAKY